MKHEITLSDGTIATLGESPRGDGAMGIYLISYEGVTAYDKLIDKLRIQFGENAERIADIFLTLYDLKANSGIAALSDTYYGKEERNAISGLIRKAYQESLKNEAH